MFTVTASGNLGRDSELRSTRDGKDVLSFSVAVKQGYGRDAKSEWIRCSIWGERGARLKDYLLKGVKVVVTGEMTIGEYQGKPQFDVRVNEVELMSRAEQNAGRQERGGGSSQGRGGQSYASTDWDDDADSVPF